MFKVTFVLYQCGGLGVTAGAHRLWAHRSYKAKWPLRLILTIFNTLAFEVSCSYLKKSSHNSYEPTIIAPATQRN
ncbi:hypothetical protein NQ314_019408 [Rhamnusium bicolor]|uniref:Uncharacterized protein n=1 Tax=Rhamnusium bicolor TaxID=1586634 RepID=A0AAV8WQR2_9CUCU|nr:hypothetical protein NQ314_019408 [Rhamnusium bicolor]